MNKYHDTVLILPLPPSCIKVLLFNRLLCSIVFDFPLSKVGAYLKTPRYPIWVVCSESHFSVLFGLQRELLTNPDRGLEFDLYYYDGLANQQEEIRLTVCM